MNNNEDINLIYEASLGAKQTEHRRFLVEFEARTTTPGRDPGRWWLDCVSYDSERVAMDDIFKRVNGTKWTQFRNIRLIDTIKKVELFSTGSF